MCKVGWSGFCFLDITWYLHLAGLKHFVGPSTRISGFGNITSVQTSSWDLKFVYMYIAYVRGDFDYTCTLLASGKI